MVNKQWQFSMAVVERQESILEWRPQREMQIMKKEVWKTKLESNEEEGITPESSVVELLAKLWEKNSVLAEGKRAVVPSEETEGEKEERGKVFFFFLFFFAKYQK